MELLLPVDPEQAVIDELTPFYPNQVGSSIPKNIPGVFIRVLAVGGAERDLVTDSPLVTIEVFARLESIAGNVSRRVVAILQAAGRSGQLGTETCYGVSISTLPQNYPLPSVPTHKRYISTLAPNLRRRVATI